MINDVEEMKKLILMVNKGSAYFRCRIREKKISFDDE
jgi:hypothetical protein